MVESINTGRKFILYLRISNRFLILKAENFGSPRQKMVLNLRALVFKGFQLLLNVF